MSFGGKRQPRKITVQDDDEDHEDGGAPVRPSLKSRSSASKLKKRASGARLSFGPSEGTSGSEAMVLDDELPVFTPKKSSLVAAATENSAQRKGIAKNSRIPLRSVDKDEDRPIYSKEYLAELQSSTPNTPAKPDLPNVADEHVAMDLDPSELEGATVVSPAASTALWAEPKPSSSILTETEIAEKKARRERERARMAAQPGTEDFISLDDGDDNRATGDSYLDVLSRSSVSNQVAQPRKEKRLTADDDLADDDSFFVEDGGLSLGKKAQREAARKKRADMANMIAAAEGHSDGETSDDSEAERRAAYERAQTKAGMDGLAEEREAQQRRLGARATVVPPKITPLPDLSVMVEDFKARMGRKEVELRRMRDRIDELRREREGVERREPEVQAMLNEAGERYRELMAASGPETNAPTPGASERGLESIGV